MVSDCLCMDTKLNPVLLLCVGNPKVSSRTRDTGCRVQQEVRHHQAIPVGNLLEPMQDGGPEAGAGTRHSGDKIK